MLTGRVTGTFGRTVATGGIPAPLTGVTVTFDAEAVEVPDGTDFVIPDRVECSVDAQGRITDPTDPTGANLGVELAATEAVPEGFAYRIRVAGPTIGTVTRRIVVHAGQTVDLADQEEEP